MSRHTAAGLDLARSRLENLVGVGGRGGVGGGGGIHVGLSRIGQFSTKAPNMLLIEGNNHLGRGGGSVALRVSSKGK